MITENIFQWEHVHASIQWDEVKRVKITLYLKKKVSRLCLHKMRVLKYYVENKAQLET